MPISCYHDRHKNCTVQEITIAAVKESVKDSWKEKQKIFKESRNQKREKTAVLQIRSVYIKPKLTKTMEKLKVHFGKTER